MPDNPCRAAIRRVFPENVWTQAYVVQYKENRAGSPTAQFENRSKKTGRLLSTDWGCLQINDHYHFHHGHWDGHPKSSFNDIFDPEFNVAMSKAIYDGAGHSWRRQNAVCGIYWKAPKGCPR